MILTAERLSNYVLQTETAALTQHLSPMLFLPAFQQNISASFCARERGCYGE